MDSCSGESSAVSREKSMTDSETLWNVSSFMFSFSFFGLCFPSEVTNEKKCSEGAG